MTTCTVSDQSGITWLTISGRVDGMTSPDVQHCIDDLILGGKRLLVADLGETNFVSSAGLRVFLTAQKELKKVGGELVLYGITSPVLPVFVTSGFDRLFKILSDEDEVRAAIAPHKEPSETTTLTEDGISFRCRETPATRGRLVLIGSQEKIPSATYCPEDVVTVPQQSLWFGTGLATVGDRYEQYRDLFGEAVFINRNFFFYPAVKRPAVDFMLYSGSDAGTECRFLHGFRFDGTCRYLAAFETAGAAVSLDRLMQWVLTVASPAALLGVVLLAESKGLMGMNLKQVPVQENRPADGKDIFDAAHFASWINFPVEPADMNHIVVAAGIACSGKDACSGSVQGLFSAGANFHLHAAVFEKGPISKNLDDFQKELSRVMTELDVAKVQHLLGRSSFSNGMLGIIELEG